jgi:hypothetical protein
MTGTRLECTQGRAGEVRRWVPMADRLRMVGDAAIESELYISAREACFTGRIVTWGEGCCADVPVRIVHL